MDSQIFILNTKIQKIIELSKFSEIFFKHSFDCLAPDMMEKDIMDRLP